MKLTVALLTLSGVISCVRSFDVPEPMFEVFHPRGLRVSIPDSEGVQSVQFLLSVKSQDEDAQEMFDDPEKSEDGRWQYWNPEAVLEKEDQIYYKITVEYDDLYWDREGEYTVDDVYSLDGGLVGLKQNRVLGFGGQQNLNIFRNRHRGLLTEGKKSSYQSSYSSYQSSDSKPITRSSTSSATGTFLMKPNGEVEASGYKKSESYDSTKREGEQWEMRESEMTPEELEELKRFIGPSFRSFEELTQGQVEEFKRLHGSNFHIPERLRSPLPEKIHPRGSNSYEESYFAKESSSSHRNQGSTMDYARRPSAYQYHERQSAHEATAGRVNPVYPVPTPVRPSSTNRFEDHRYNHQSSSTLANPVALSHTSSNDSPDYQQEVPVALPSSRHSSRNYEFSRGESHHVSSHGGIRPVTPTNPSPSYLTSESETDRYSQSRVSQHHENYDNYDSEDVQVVEKPKYRAESHYTGSIFRSITTSRVNNPQECAAWAETNYDHVTDLKEIQKSISKMSCLASLAEHSMREELRLLKQQNSDLLRKMESLDRDCRNKCSG